MAYFGGRMSDRQIPSMGSINVVPEYNDAVERWQGAVVAPSLNSGPIPFQIPRLRNSMLRSWGGLNARGSGPSNCDPAWTPHPIVQIRAGGSPARNTASLRSLYGTQSPSVYIPGVLVTPYARS
jgi:hypothetical protein